MTNVHYLPPRHSQGDRTADALRYTRADLAEAIDWINRYRSYLATGSMTPAYRKHVEAGLQRRVRDYLAGLRQAHDYEAQLDALGVVFIRT